MPAFLRAPEVGNELEYLGPARPLAFARREGIKRSAGAALHRSRIRRPAWRTTRDRWEYVRALSAYGAQHPDDAGQMAPEKVGRQPRYH